MQLSVGVPPLGIAFWNSNDTIGAAADVDGTTAQPVGQGGGRFARGRLCRSHVPARSSCSLRRTPINHQAAQAADLSAVSPATRQGPLRVGFIMCTRGAHDSLRGHNGPVRCQAGACRAIGGALCGEALAGVLRRIHAKLPAS
jgi:hypothetical protein